MKKRQDLINILHSLGVGITGTEMDRRIKIMNGHEMSLSSRHDWCCKNIGKCLFWFTDGGI